MKVRPAAQRGTVSSEGRQQEILAKTPRPQRNIRTNLGGLCVSWRPWRESGSQPQPQHIARRSNGISTTYGVLSRVREFGVYHFMECVVR